MLRCEFWQRRKILDEEPPWKKRIVSELASMQFTLKSMLSRCNHFAFYFILHVFVFGSSRRRRKMQRSVDACTFLLYVPEFDEEILGDEERGRMDGRIVQQCSLNCSDFLTCHFCRLFPFIFHKSLWLALLQRLLFVWCGEGNGFIAPSPLKPLSKDSSQIAMAMEETLLDSLRRPSRVNTNYEYCGG